ncbi:OTUB1 [Blepharisma stoltei]|uniref:ubiquitinyl hydrolase 1 n=1 Tax=Blepharisma stoltei TaxID=1481888 RepID=A0AAU9JQL5_9CILI|nr:unnamed protein product [Blepharisma stoltei]
MEDFSIIKQQDEILREIEERQPMFTPVQDFSSLEVEYASNPPFQAKIPYLQSKYSGFRRTRGDGNCFYRSFIFSLFEQLIQNKSHLSNPDSPYSQIYSAIKQKVLDSGDILNAAGFLPICYEDFIDMISAKLEMIPTTEISQLEDDFKDKIIADTYVMYTRFIVSAFLRLHADEYSGFVEGYPDIVSFCNSEVDPMNRECEQLQIIAMTEAFQIKAEIEYMDRNDRTETTLMSFPFEYTGPDFKIHMLYRPGHYDILYPNRS